MTSPTPSQDSPVRAAPAPISRLSAIVLVDAVGSSQAMNEDEVAALRAVENALDMFGAKVTERLGRVLNYTGDGALAVFDSVASAIDVALEFQKMQGEGAPGATVMGFRAGVHLGEVFESGGRAYGDSLNLTERIQSASQIGGVCVSDLVYRAIRSRSEFLFEYLGPYTGKHMLEPVELYRVHAGGTAAMLKASPRPLSARSATPKESDRSSQSEHPSIAILPFRNLSRDPAEDYFADGVTDDIITSLSRFRGIDLIARGSSFVLRDTALGLKEIGARLGARYVAQGSIRRSERRVRVTIELSDTETEHTLWAERYDRPLEDIFEIQDEIAALAVSVMSVRIEDAERKRMTSAQPDSLHAYGLVLKGHSHLVELTASDTALARGFYEKGILASPRYARAFAGLSRTNSLDWRYSWSADPPASLNRAFDIAVQAVGADPNDARGHAELGFVLLYRKEHDRSLSSYRRAVALNPNDANIIAEMADALTHAGESEESLKHFEHAVRLNPFYPDQYLWDMAGAYMKLHRFQEAIDCVLRMHNVSQGRRILACCYAHLGKMEDARREAEFIRAAQPGFTAEHWVEIVPDRRPEDKATLLEGLKKAGL